MTLWLWLRFWVSFGQWRWQVWRLRRAVQAAVRAQAALNAAMLEAAQAQAWVGK